MVDLHVQRSVVRTGVQAAESSCKALRDQMYRFLSAGSGLFVVLWHTHMQGQWFETRKQHKPAVVHAMQGWLDGQLTFQGKAFTRNSSLP